MIYHVTDTKTWQNALDKGHFEAASLHTEGFIHTSKKEQVAGVLQRYYKDREDLLLLHIDESLLTAPLKYEFSPSVNEVFPHVFGPINLESVVQTESI
jgi:uncharacterized protein (DUF952 family)